MFHTRLQVQEDRENVRIGNGSKAGNSSIITTGGDEAIVISRVMHLYVLDVVQPCVVS